MLHRTTRRPRRRRGSRRGFSIIEMQIAALISALLLSATLVALDTMFKGYRTNADSASAHVVTRITVNRLLTLIRTGTDFGPVSNDIFDECQNPIISDFFEFVSDRGADGFAAEVTRIEYRFPGEGAQHRIWSECVPPPALDFENAEGDAGELWLVRTDLATDAETEFLLLRDVRAARFTMRYDRGPQLVRCTIDITVDPEIPESVSIGADAPPQTVRVVASAMPRRAFD